MKNILIIGPPSLGYLKKIDEELQKNNNVNSSMILIDRYSFSYRNTFHRIQNFFLKTFFSVNLKKQFVNTVILDKTKELGKQDVIFIIRPDLLKESTLKKLKSFTNSLEAFYYDSTRRFPDKIDIIPLFDKVYSYDPLDVKTYNLEFLTNYIYEESNKKDYKDLFFNISTFDYRFDEMEKIAEYIDSNGWSKNIKVLGGDDVSSNTVEIIKEQIPVDKVKEFIEDSKIIVEVQREEQLGLSFRAFEALGYRKKFVTTNRDVVNYDFYNPNNILVIDSKNIVIPEEFVTTPYKEVDEAILAPYKVENWVKKVFNLN